MPLRCLIVDDNPGFLAAARDLLECQGVSVVGVASTSAEARRRSRELRPDVTLVDIDLGGESGFDVVRALADDEARPIVLISTYAEQDFSELVATSPAAGFVSKSDLSRAAIESVLSRLPRLPPAA
jgi:DNA-binding NarL/FixJ family response regulator